MWLDLTKTSIMSTRAQLFVVYLAASIAGPGALAIETTVATVRQLISLVTGMHRHHLLLLPEAASS